MSCMWVFTVTKDVVAALPHCMHCHLYDISSGTHKVQASGKSEVEASITVLPSFAIFCACVLPGLAGGTVSEKRGSNKQQ